MSQKPPLFKGQGIRLVGIAVGLAVGLLVLFVVQIFVAEKVPSIVLLIVAGVAVVVVSGTVLAGLLLGRKAFGQRLEIALRPAGETKWQHGYIDATPGHMRFHRYRWQIRFVTGEPADYVIDEIGASSGRRPSKKQLLSVNPALHIVDVQTDRGPLELALQAHQVDDIRARLDPESGPSLPSQDQ